MFKSTLLKLLKGGPSTLKDLQIIKVNRRDFWLKTQERTKLCLVLRMDSNLGRWMKREMIKKK